MASDAVAEHIEDVMPVVRESKRMDDSIEMHDGENQDQRARKHEEEHKRVPNPQLYTVLSVDDGAENVQGMG